jgi:hypothetical protein
MSETKIKVCTACGGAEEQVNLSVPGGVEDCRACRGNSRKRVPVQRELVEV